MPLINAFPIKCESFIHQNKITLSPRVSSAIKIMCGKCMQASSACCICNVDVMFSVFHFYRIYSDKINWKFEKQESINESQTKSCAKKLFKTTASV